jgi:hypothetical protein
MYRRQRIHHWKPGDPVIAVDAFVTRYGLSCKTKPEKDVR